MAERAMSTDCVCDSSHETMDSKNHFAEEAETVKVLITGFSWPTAGPHKICEGIPKALQCLQPEISVFLDSRYKAR